LITTDKGFAEHRDKQHYGKEENNDRERKWSQSIAVGSEAYIVNIKEALGFKARGRKIDQTGDSFELRETPVPYKSTDSYETDNMLPWDQ